MNPRNVHFGKTSRLQVFRDMTTRYLIVTEWVNGEKASNLEATTPEGKACLATLQVPQDDGGESVWGEACMVCFSCQATDEASFHD